MSSEGENGQCCHFSLAVVWRTMFEEHGGLIFTGYLSPVLFLLLDLAGSDLVQTLLNSSQVLLHSLFLRSMSVRAKKGSPFNQAVFILP